MRKVGVQLDDSTIAKQMLRNHEVTARKHYFEKDMGLECRETLNTIRFAADKLEFEETDDDFQLQQKLPQSAQSKMPALPKIQNAMPAPLEPPELSQIVPSKRNREGEIIECLPCPQIPDVIIFGFQILFSAENPR